MKKVLGVGALAGGAWWYSQYGLSCPFVKAKGPDWNAVRKDITALIESNPEYDGYGSYGPVFIRLAWHASGTYNARDGTGGSNYSTMRFKPECDDPANAGLSVARDVLESVKKRHPTASYADIWTLAGATAVEYMGGPNVPWSPGRADADAATAKVPPNGRLPDAAGGPDHVREVFARQGFTDEETVALLGAHAVGKCHRTRSGFEGPWTHAPTTFSNAFYTELLSPDNAWHKAPAYKGGPTQYRNKAGDIMMLPADMALLEDPTMRAIVTRFAASEPAFFAAFAAAFAKMLNNGVPSPAPPFKFATK